MVWDILLDVLLEEQFDWSLPEIFSLRINRESRSKIIKFLESDRADKLPPLVDDAYKLFDISPKISMYICVSGGHLLSDSHWDIPEWEEAIKSDPDLLLYRNLAKNRHV